jgi:biotin synthase
LNLSLFLEKAKSGQGISLRDAIKLHTEANLDKLLQAADEVRSTFHDNTIDLCSIINARSGSCSEDCKYCAQSARYNTHIETYDFMDEREIIRQAKENEASGVKRFSIVTSGKALGGREFEKVLHLVRRLKDETSLKICASIGCIQTSQILRLKQAGLDLLHHNLETSRRFFPQTCSTHSYDDRLATVKSAREAGLECCCGGIIGLGETPEDRYSMALEVRALDVSSFPVNILTPIPGTPYGKMKSIDPEEAIRSLAIFRFLLPKAVIRFAGGRISLGQHQRKALHGGVNGMMVGNYLTTVGNRIPEDLTLIRSEGFGY